MSSEQLSAIHTAIQNCLKGGGGLGRIQNVDSFLSGVPCSLSTRQLKSLITQHRKEIANMAGAKDVEWVGALYKPSGRGAFGKSKGGDRATRTKPYIRFTY